MRCGFYLVGKFLGYKTSNFLNRETGDVKVRFNLGLELKEPNGYGGYNSYTQEVKVDEDVFKSSIAGKFDSYKDEQVMILVTPREWAMENGRKGITYNFDVNSTIQVVDSE